MEEQAEALRQRIALHRRYLREGVTGERAAECLRQIREDTEALRRIEGWEASPGIKDPDRRDEPPEPSSD
jgi:hypothetical protein